MEKDIRTVHDEYDVLQIKPVDTNQLLNTTTYFGSWLKIPFKSQNSEITLSLEQLIQILTHGSNLNASHENIQRVLLTPGLSDPGITSIILSLDQLSLTLSTT